MTDKTRSPISFGTAAECFFAAYIILELGLFLSAVISRFKFRLPRHPGSSFVQDGRFGFDFAQTLSGLSFSFVFLMTITAIICLVLSLTKFKPASPKQTQRIVALFILGLIMWMPSLVAMLAYSI